MASRLEIQNLNRDLNNFVIEGNFYTTSPGWGGGGSYEIENFLLLITFLFIIILISILNILSPTCFPLKIRINPVCRATKVGRLLRMHKAK